MDKFRESRRASKKKQSPQKLEGLSPEKFGKAAYEDKYFTPFKLADNVLYKEMNSMKKYEECSQKLRQVEGSKQFLENKLQKILKEKEMIQTRLRGQIQMYKKCNQQMEQKTQQRLIETQNSFKNQINQILKDKQEQMEYFQAQKQYLQTKIDQLQAANNELDQNLKDTVVELKNLQQNNQNLSHQVNQLTDKITENQHNYETQSAKYQQSIDTLKEKVISAEREWRDKLDEKMMQKQAERKQQEKQHKQDIKLLNQERENQRQEKNQQIKNLTASFENEKKNLNQTIIGKEKKNQQLKQKMREENEKMHSSTKAYEQQIASLAQEKARLFQEVDSLNEQNTNLNIMMKEEKVMTAQERSNLEAYVSELKDNLNFNHLNLLRERDRNCYQVDDSQKQNLYLKNQLSELKRQNECLRQNSKNKDFLRQQIGKLKDLLSDSSIELGRSKQQIMKIGLERDLLKEKLEEICYQNEALKRIKLQREQQARSWRDSYYLTRSRKR